MGSENTSKHYISTRHNFPFQYILMSIIYFPLAIDFPSGPCYKEGMAQTCAGHHHLNVAPSLP